MRTRPSPRVVRENLRYDAATGNLWWKIATNKRPANKPAGWNGSQKRRFVKLFGQTYPATHLAWVIVKGRWPRYQVDHRDLNPANNRWTNLRSATNQQNVCNKRARSDNKSGYKGVCWKAKNRQWVAQICVRGVVKHLGLFPTPESAHAVYATAAKKHFGAFARAN